MKLIVGLGNPGSQYANTKHNIGFRCVDELIKKYNVTFKLESKFKAEVAVINLDEKIIVVKPLTYMNLSGEAIALLMRYYKIDLEDILVIYDDLDLDFGALRLRESGSAGGHNGIKNLISHLGTQDFKRIRVGISRNHAMSVTDYVLSKLNKDEEIILNSKMNNIIDACVEFINRVNFKKIMSKYN